MKYTVVWESRWQSGSHWHCLAKVTRFIDTPIEKIMSSEYGKNAVYIFEGHSLMIGTNELEMVPIKLD